MNRIIPLLLYVFHASFGHSTITSAEVKGTYEIFKEDNRHLSILPGMIWVKGGVLENLAEISFDEKDPNIRLINELFHRVQQTFRETSSANNVATYFSPRLMGQIAAILNNFDLYLHAKERKTLLES